MATVNFYLKNPQDKGETLIYLFFSYTGNRLKYSTGEKITPKDWNPEDQTVRKSLAGSKEFNDYLKKVETSVNTIYRTAITDEKQPTPDYLRDQLNATLQNSPQRLQSFNDYLDQFIEVKRATITNVTLQKYKTLQSHLLAFQKKEKFKITFEKIDMNFYDKLIAWFTNDLEFLNNTTGKYIIALKSFMTWATDRGHNSNSTYLRFKAPHNSVDIVYLSEIELMQLYNHDFSENLRLEQVRDSFCFGCFTGLRFSDIGNVKKEHIKGDCITMSIQKTKQQLVIPLNDYSKDILKKYDYKLPTITNQKTNDYLKELGKIAKLKATVTIKKFRGAKQIEIKEPKYKFLSSHCARRTFVTLSLEKGMRAETVMSITGHTQYETFKKYIKLTSKIKVVEMQQIWNKKPTLQKVS